MEARLHAPGAVDATAGVDQRHLGAGQLEECARREADVLGAQVTRGGVARQQHSDIQVL